MKSTIRSVLMGMLVVLAVYLAAPAPLPAAGDGIVQGQAVLTVAESKRLIGKGVAQMPIVKNALANGLVIIVKGTTNLYVAEEITGRKIEHARFARGRVEPQKGGKHLPPVEALPDVVIEKGKEINILLTEAVKRLKPGDVVMKGANALDYNNKIAGVYIGDPTGGTTGITLPYVVARKAYFVIPIGLEKLVAGNVADISRKMREPIETLNGLQSMFLLTGEIVTEIEALKILTGVTAFQAGGGGIGGAEGSVWLVLRGTRDQVQKTLDLIKSIQGEPPFVE
jgi:hypothetical protein